MKLPPHHHSGGRFRNPWHGGDSHPSRLRSAGWLLSFPFRRRVESGKIPFQPIDPGRLRIPMSQNGVRVTWLGHTTCLIQISGINILTDPVFAKRASPLSFVGPQRETPLPIDPADLPAIDVVLLSHDHYDHLDLAALTLLHERDQPLIAAPLHLPAHFNERLADAAVVELDWYESHLHTGLRYHCTPAKHFSGRGLFDRDRTLWCSWYIETEANGARVYFGGDSGYAPHFAEIADRLGAPQIVLMPIGAYEPRWFMRRVHVDPAEAVQAFLDMSDGTTSAHLIPTHWGTFRLTDEPLDEPPRLLMEEVASHGIDDGHVHVLSVGGTIEIEPTLTPAGLRKRPR